MTPQLIFCPAKRSTPAFTMRAAAVLGLTFSALATARADMVLVDAATPPCPIVTTELAVRGKKPPLETEIALELAKTLKEMTGKEFPLVAATAELPERAIVVGEHGMSAPAELGSGGYIIKTRGQRLYLVGGKVESTAYSVFDFLQRELGCRWNMHMRDKES